MTTATDTVSKVPTNRTITALISAVESELADIVTQLADDAVVSRLTKSADLLKWLRIELGVDRTDESAAEARLLAANSGGGEAEREQREALLRLRALRSSMAAPSEHSAAVVMEADQSAEARPGGIPSVEQVTEYLDARNAGDRAHSVRAIVGGYSKVTLLVTATLNGDKQEIVLRQTPAGRQSRSLGIEFGVVQFVYDRGLPAPKPLWIEPSENGLGGAFFAMEKAAGANIGDVWGTKGATREICLEIAEIYARLHQIPVDGLTTPISPRSTPSELQAMITWQRDVLDKRGIEVEPVLATLLTWLESNIPAEAPRKSLIHGDAAFSNLLINDGHVSAVLDWEAAHIGDAADELAYLKPSVESVMPWSDFVAHYVSAGGLEPTDQAMRFYEVWSHVWRAMGCLWLKQNFESTGRYASAVAAFVHGPRFLDEAVTAAFL
ncbi:phosphotransferase family protein [Rhodococcus qingshengii]|uniref:phosphotransferase family protein n=1 Tax=Rhodococcus qingshengii TaxID=334542 RepID=UPI001456173D|nr:phosphotransferase family protein [Rhodococcus qingshengii]